jgi:hypothetical protein
MNPLNLVSSSTEPRMIFWFAATAMSLFFVASISATIVLLKRCPGWSIGDALSEEANPQGALAPGQKPLLIASASRIIALVGTLVLMGAVIGISYFVLWALFYEQSLDSLSKLGPLFYGAEALFAPYVVNQAREALTGFKRGSAVPATSSAKAPAS